MRQHEPIVYLNGDYLPASRAMVSIDDRGFLFADACYEVTAVVHGRCVALDRHLHRLQRGLDELRIRFDTATLRSVHDELIARNRLSAEPRSLIYVQVTRGVAARSHAFPADVRPTVLARSTVGTGPTDEIMYDGATAVTRPDLRWGRVDIKSTGLLPNVLAQQAAVDAGADDVILHRGDTVTEGSHTNVLGVIGGVVVTAPADHGILHGVTRAIVLELATADGIVVEERSWSIEELRAADEIMMTSTTAGVRPIVTVDGRPVGSGQRGPVTERLQALFAGFVSEARR